MNTVEAAGGDSSLDRARVGPRSVQLHHRKNTVLAGGDFGNDGIRTGSGSLLAHSDTKAPSPPISPPSVLVFGAATRRAGGVRWT